MGRHRLRAPRARGVRLTARRARDLALGAGALYALRTGDDAAARTWIAAHAVSDGIDLLSTLAARRALPSGPAAFAVAMAGASTVIGVAGALRLGR